MQVYAPNQKMVDARKDYFERNNFNNGGYDEAWVKLKVGPIPLAFPNTKSRVRAVRLHDLHHVLTEYDTNWRGEAQIGAWEVASGCGNYYAAWLLNIWVLGVGLVIAPRRTYRAFMRGRVCQNLYRGNFEEALLEKEVGAMRSELNLNSSAHSTDFKGKVALVFWAIISLIAWVAPYVVLFLIIWLVRR